MRRLWIAALGLFLAYQSPAWAQEVSVSKSTVIVNGITVATIRTNAVNGAKPSARAQNFATALNGLAAGTDIQVRAADKTQVIFINGYRVLAVTRKEAKAHGVTMLSLASTWASRLRAALAIPPLVVSDTDVRMPSPSNRTITLRGYLKAKAVATTSAPDVVTTRRVGDNLELAANAPGTADITVAAGETIQTISVTVQPYAANLPQTFSLEVAGSPALASTVQGAVEGAIRTRLRRLPGTRLTIEKIAAEAVGDGQSKSISATVEVEGQDVYDRRGTVNVVVRNSSVPTLRDQALWYSNNPENVEKAGSLFGAFLKRGEGCRLLYHHINAASYPIFLRAQVVNDSDYSARVLVIPGDSNPDKNPVRAGIRAAEQYFRAWASGSGEIITIPPRSTLPISLRRLAPQQTVSGLCSIRLLDGPPNLLVRTDAWPPFNLEKRWEAVTDSSAPWRIVGCNPITDYDSAPYEVSSHIYPNPFKRAAFRYEVGGRYGFFKIGERPISGSDSVRVLDGNFGVIYTIKAEMTNPTQIPTDVELVFEASAGYSGGLFLVDGVLTESPLLQPKAEFRIGKFRLAPGETRKVELVTIPLSGSSYPSLISMRPMQTLNAGIGN